MAARPNPVNCLNSTASAVWYSSAGASPCSLLQSMHRLCDTTFSIDYLTTSLNYVSSNYTWDDCSCSSITFGVTNACYLCQSSATGDFDADFRDVTARFQDWNLACLPKYANNNTFATPTLLDRMWHIGMPKWVWITRNKADFDLKWNLTAAFQNASAYIVPSNTTNDPAPSFSSTTSLPTDSNSSSTSTPTGAIAGGVVGGVVAVGLFAALLWWFLRRRREGRVHRQKTEMDLMDVSIEPFDEGRTPLALAGETDPFFAPTTAASEITGVPPSPTFTGPPATHIGYPTKAWRLETHSTPPPPVRSEEDSGVILMTSAESAEESVPPSYGSLR